MINKNYFRSEAFVSHNIQILYIMRNECQSYLNWPDPLLPPYDLPGNPVWPFFPQGGFPFRQVNTFSVFSRNRLSGEAMGPTEFREPKAAPFPSLPYFHHFSKVRRPSLGVYSGEIYYLRRSGSDGPFPSRSSARPPPPFAPASRRVPDCAEYSAPGG
jgi:hypothetical protein